MSAITAIRSFLKLFVKSGPESRTLFNDMPYCLAEESKTTLILSFYLGWYTPNKGRYQHSSFCSKVGASPA